MMASMNGLNTYKTGILFTLSDSVDAKEHDVELVIKYRVSPGCEPTREQPGEGPTVSIESAILRSLHVMPTTYEDAPRWLWPYLEDDEALTAELLAHAAASDEYARDQAADARREERRLSL